MEHTVARVVTPTPGPVEVFVPPPAEPPATSTPVLPVPTPTPTVVAMPVVTALAPGNERSPGVLYEQYVPTVAAITATPGAAGAAPTRTASPRSTRPRLTPTPAATRRPGVYYEDAEGRPLPTVTP
jgi:hypothetical protein